MLFLTHLPDVELPDVDYMDKVLHSCGYAALTFAIGSLLAIQFGYQPRFAIWVWMLAVAYGVVDEYTQQFVHRTSDVADLLADAAGAALGLLALHAGALLVRRCRSPQPLA